MAGTSEMQPISKTSTFLSRADVAFAFHLLAFVLYLRVWLWHTSPAALFLPGATGFGWFFRYLTFCSYTLQLLQLFICCLAHLTKHPRRRAALTVTADRLACALFGLANTVTAMFYAVENATQGLVEGGAIERPWWLDLSVHAANSGVAWIDLFIVEERSFSGRSRHLALGMALAYCFWLLVIRRYFSKFPYPIMNKLPFPAGYLGFAAAGVATVALSFELGRVVKHRVLRSPPSAGAAGAARRRKAQ